MQGFKSGTINSHGVDRCKVGMEVIMAHHKSFTITSLSKTSGINANLTHRVLSYYSLLRNDVNKNKQEGKNTRFTNLPNSIIERYRYSNLFNWCLFVILLTDIRVLVKENTK
jgi:predicted transcriptional regulator